VQAAIGTFLALQTEAVTGADFSTVVLLASAAIAEGASGDAAAVSQINVKASVAEVVSALSSFGVVKTANVFPAGVQLFISIGSTLVWAAVNDNQSPNWQNVNDAQTPNWQDVNDTQTPGWNNLPS
jgi:hypothetical protein